IAVIFGLLVFMSGAFLLFLGTLDWIPTWQNRPTSVTVAQPVAATAAPEPPNQAPTSAAIDGGPPSGERPGAQGTPALAKEAPAPAVATRPPVVPRMNPPPRAQPNRKAAKPTGRNP